MGWVSSLEDRLERFYEDMEAFRDRAEAAVRRTPWGGDGRAQIDREFAALAGRAQQLLLEVQSYADIATDPSVEVALAHQQICKELDALRELHAETRAAIADLETENAALRAKVAELEARPGTLARRVAELLRENERLRSRLPAMEPSVPSRSREGHQVQKAGPSRLSAETDLDTLYRQYTSPDLIRRLKPNA
jgi:chromosome segregation ATPase